MIRTELTHIDDSTLDGIPFHFVICAEKEDDGEGAFVLYCTRFGEVEVPPGTTAPAAWCPLALGEQAGVRDAFLDLAIAIVKALAATRYDETQHAKRKKH
jgi:hypothetical protein